MPAARQAKSVTTKGLDHDRETRLSRALLAAAEAMALRLEYIATAYEHAQWQEDGGVTN